MKTLKSLFIVLIATLVCACEKTLSLKEPAFNVNNTSVTDGVDETGNPIKNVTFELSGDAEFITFYSGETLHEYNFKDGRIVKTKALEMSFSSNCKLNSGTIAPPNQLTVLMSTNFSGKYEQADIEAAQWKDISNRFKLSPLVTTDDFLTSGTIDLNELAEKGKPIFIAFKYITPPQTTAQRHTQWRIRNFAVKRINDLGNIIVASQETTAWNLYHKGPFETGRSSNSSSQLILRGNNSAVNFAEPTEDWAISPAIQIINEADLGPDRPVAIKSRAENQLTKFTYAYKTTGTYKAVFVAANVNIKTERELVKEVNVTIK